MKPRVALAWLAACALLAGGLGGFQSGSAPGRHVVLISIDGLRPDFYLDPRAHGARLPIMEMMMRSGAYAEGVVGSYPSVTYPAHTTLVTGVRPARHGVLDNYVFDARGRFENWHWHSEAIRAPTLWDVARRQGGEVAALSWPVTVGAAIDYHVPEFWIPASAKTRREQLASVMSEATLEELESELGILTDARFEGEAWDGFLAAAARFWLRKYRPDLLLLHLVFTDSMQHAHGREHPAVAAAFETMDRRLGDLLRTLDESGLGASTLVVVTGDHGFIDVHSRINLNVALAHAGLLGLSPEGEVEDWKALAWPAGGSCALVLRDAENEAAREELESVVGELLGGPLGSVMRRVSREELDALGAMPSAAMVLEAAEGYYFGKGLTGEVLESSGGDRGHHGFLPELKKMRTGFLMVGPGVRAGIRIPVMQQTDIAPTIARWAGWELPSTEGLALSGLFEEEALPGRASGVAASRRSGGPARKLLAGSSAPGSPRNGPRSP